MDIIEAGARVVCEEMARREPAFYEVWKNCNEDAKNRWRKIARACWSAMVDALTDVDWRRYRRRSARTATATTGRHGLSLFTKSELDCLSKEKGKENPSTHPMDWCAGCSEQECMCTCTAEELEEMDL
uniref:Uncharacterized protein n=1 Tax=viral metagenome TaxID=1070528 RepID=A0A6M3L1Y2_9ZZZZ